MTCLQDDSAAFAIDSISLSAQPSSERQRRSISVCKWQRACCLEVLERKELALLPSCCSLRGPGDSFEQYSLHSLLPAFNHPLGWAVQLPAGVSVRHAGAVGLKTEAQRLFR